MPKIPKFNRGPKMPGAGPNGLLLLLLFVGMGLLFLVYNHQTHNEIEPLTYSSFLHHVEKGHVKKVKITNGTEVRGFFTDTYRPRGAFEVSIEKSEMLWQTLHKHNVDIAVEHHEKNPYGNMILFIFFLALLGLGFFYLRNMQNGGGSGKIFNISKSKARMHPAGTINVKFDDVAGVVEAKEDLNDIVEFLRDPNKFERLGAKVPRGILLCGAPGNGKTLLAKAIAGEANCSFYSVSGSDFVEVFVGVGASRVRDLFAQARRTTPCIIFIDEIDAVGRKRGVGNGGGNDEREQTLNQLLAEMDGFATERGAVIVLAATNRPDVLDNALLRPGRFDRSVEVPYPDLKSREHILNVHIKKIVLNKEIDTRRIARGTPGFSGADLENLVNEAALVATKKEKKEVTIEDFEIARDKIILGSERKTMIQTDEEKEVTAYHEGGHTLLNLLLPKTDPFQRVTIVPRGRALGVSMSLPERDTYQTTRQKMLQQVQVALGGFIAEELIFGEQTSGASSDIQKATQIIRAMVCEYGMSRLGPIQFSSRSNNYLGFGASSKEYSGDTARQIDEEIARIMKECQENATKLLTENRDKLETLAKELIEKETLEADEVYELLDIPPRTYHSFAPKKEITPCRPEDEVPAEEVVAKNDDDYGDDAGAGDAHEPSEAN
ncbi:MAG: ATP-dependent zinc metalloprotease FtsH [Candidatus Dependentiae bacterium]|jgi:cell division protease FtsH